MNDQVMLRVMTRLTAPFMMAFGLYVITHGEVGPGGGFQGGVILAAGFIIYGVVFGRDALETLLPHRLTDLLATGGVLLYAGVGVACMLKGGRFLDYAALMPAHPGAGEVWGMTLVEYGVGLTVFSVMITIFNKITEPDEGETGGSAGEAAP